MTLNNFKDLATKMGIDPDQEIEILWPDGSGGWDYSPRFNIHKAADGGVYITPEKISG